MKQINLNKINCWIINLMPFPKDERYSSEVLPFQQECIKIIFLVWVGRQK